jgi:sialate O-acetylesterase
MKFTLLIFGLALPAFLTDAPLAQVVKLPAIFRDHMVLQRDVSVPVWGQADAGSEVTVRFAGQSKTAIADAEGRWEVRLDPISANNEPREMRIGNSVLRDVLVGEVWLCSGQSNMRWIVGPVDKFPGVEGAEEEIARPERPELRLFSDDGEEVWQQRGWQRASGERVARFSATAYFFGQMLHRELGVPVGVINVSRGGTSVQAWTRREFALRNPFTRHYVELEEKSRDIIRNYNEAQRQSRLARQAGKKGSPPPVVLDPEIELARLFHVANLYDAHIEPLAPFAIRGVVWYQGESNASRLKTAQAYGSMLRDLIEGWRDRWGQPDMPWLVMQLPCWDGATSAPWPWVRQGQWETSRIVPNASLATTCDLSDSSNLHPAQKRAAGERLARLALAKTYGQPMIGHGPTPTGFRTDGDRLVLNFEVDGTDLAVKGDRWNDIEIAGEDGIYHPAQATLTGNAATISTAAVKTPRAVRYGWSPVFEPTLFNAAGLPAAPFALWMDSTGNVRPGILTAVKRFEKNNGSTP